MVELEKQETVNEGVDCRVRLAPLFVVHSAILIAAVAWLVAVLR